MKAIKLLVLGALCASIGSSLAAQKFRTDINPALRYYQGFLEAAQVAESDRQYLFTNEWRGQPLDQQFGDLVAKYDYQFRFLREARHSQAPCDWGIDVTSGPDALLPGLAPAKATALVTRYRVMWHLQNGRQAEAKEDLLAAFALGRRVSHDGVLISSLVQIAIENIIGSIIAENFFQWEPETLREIGAGLEAAPPRGTIARCIATEKIAFHDWLLRQFQTLQKDSGADDAKTVGEMRNLLTRIEGESNPDSNIADRFVKAAGGTSEGMVKLIREMAPLYDRVSVLMSLPYGEFDSQMRLFMTEVRSHPNPLVPMFFTVFEKCRTKEFAIEAKLAMIRAGIAYRLHGEAGLRSVHDPFGIGPFAMRRFVFEGEDRGFELKSAFKDRGHDEVLIFVEKNGAPFMIDGQNAGKK